MMPEVEQRGHQRTKPLEGQRNLTIKCHGTTGPSALAARLLDYSTQGVSIEVGDVLATGMHVEIVGDVETPSGSYALRRRGVVRQCVAAGSGKYVARLSFDPASRGTGTGHTAAADEAVDHYEVLQLSRNANLDTIQRVFRMLAKRYHPDNQETGNAALFREIVEAHKVLTDPERRAAYDAQLGNLSQNRFKIFETWQNSRGVEAEKRKRHGILALLYGKRLTDPHEPSMGVREFEEMLGCPREHLEFSLWFLRESKWISRSDNNRFEITCQGVLAAEADEEHPLPTPAPRLPAPEGHRES